MKNAVKGLLVLLSLAFAFALVGCGEAPTSHKETPKAEDVKKNVDESCCDLTTAKDGEYTAKSGEHEKLGHMEVKLTIKDHKITAVEATGITKDGKVKDETYGKKGDTAEDQGHYKKAQLAVKAHRSYAAQLLEGQKLGKVDAVSGATVSYQQFNEAVKAAIEQSKK